MRSMSMKSLALWALGLLAMPNGSWSGTVQTADRPNILLAISDDQSWVHAGAYGCPGLQTPAFDRVARQGVLFHNAFSAAPMCTVSRACLLTGRNQWQNREAGNHWSVFPRDLAVYPYLLEQAGYAIGYTGKGWSPGEWQQTGWPTNPAGPAFNDKKCKPPATGIKNVDYAAIGYPMRAIRTGRYLYVMNLKPDRWPIGDPAYVLRGRRDASNAGICIEDLPPEAHKRPAEQLFDITRDPACLKNLAQHSALKKVRDDLRNRLTDTLTRQGDPRFHGYGDIWESYPRFGVMRPYLGGFAERGKYNPKYQVDQAPRD